MSNYEDYDYYPYPSYLGKFGMRQNPDKDLQNELSMLVEEYFDLPHHLRKQDLPLINDLRSQLDLPTVDANLRVIKSIKAKEEEEEEEEEIVIDPHIETRELYEEFLEKEEMLRPHREYCSKLIRATASRGAKTPVMPLATMGTGGAALLCDTCEKQFPLEGGGWQGVVAGEAWDKHAGRASDWVSFISGHVTFLQESNGTFRVYHGYINSGCGGEASKKEEINMSEFSRASSSVPSHVRKGLEAFLEDEHNMRDRAKRNTLIQRILDELFSYDPGIGINRPD